MKIFSKILVTALFNDDILKFILKMTFLGLKFLSISFWNLKNYFESWNEMFFETMKPVAWLFKNIL